MQGRSLWPTSTSWGSPTEAWGLLRSGSTCRRYAHKQEQFGLTLYVKCFWINSEHRLTCVGPVSPSTNNESCVFSLRSDHAGSRCCVPYWLSLEGGMWQDGRHLSDPGWRQDLRQRCYTKSSFLFFLFCTVLIVAVLFLYGLLQVK